MFGDDDFARNLIEVLRLQARAIEHLAGRQNDTRSPPAKPKRLHVPQQKEYREWASFRAAFRELERVARREKQLAREQQVSREMVHDVGGPSPRTITRIMVETYGLRPEQWPPSIWPETPPKTP